MTVLPFAARACQVEPGVPGVGLARVTGSFRSPSGRAGTFTGSYRLEHLVSERGQLLAAGVFTGELVDVDGCRIGRAARRRTVPVVAAAHGGVLQVRLGRLDVDVMGLLVAVDAVTVDVLDSADHLGLIDVVRPGPPTQALSPLSLSRAVPWH